METHTPKHPVRSWRELAGEVGIIVLGVLIALGAEQTVSALDWAHKADLAQQAMRIEVRDDDGRQVYERLAYAVCTRAHLTAIRRAVETSASRAEVVKLTDGYRAPVYTWDALAYQAAVAADIPSHMPAKTMARWTSLYAEVPPLDRADEKAFNDTAALRSVSHTGGPLSEAERDRLIGAIEVLQRDNDNMLVGLAFMARSLEAAGLAPPPKAQQVRVARARASYSDGCVPTTVEEGAQAGIER